MPPNPSFYSLRSTVIGRIYILPWDPIRRGWVVASRCLEVLGRRERIRNSCVPVSLLVILQALHFASFRDQLCGLAFLRLVWRHAVHCSCLAGSCVSLMLLTNTPSDLTDLHDDMLHLGLKSCYSIVRRILSLGQHTRTHGLGSMGCNGTRLSTIPGTARQSRLM